MDDPKVIIPATSLGLIAAVLMSPLGVTFLAALFLSILLVPWVLLSPSAGPFAIFSASKRHIVLTTLRGNSNLPEHQYRIVAVSVILSSLLYAIYFQMIAEVIFRRIFGLETLYHSAWMYIAVGVVFFTVWKIFEYTARRIHKSKTH